MPTAGSKVWTSYFSIKVTFKQIIDLGVIWKGILNGQKTRMHAIYEVDNKQPGQKQ